MKSTNPTAARAWSAAALAVLVGGSGLLSRAALARRDGRDLPVLPAPVPHAAVTTATQQTRWLRDLARGPAVVLYVSRTCAHCHVELRRWAELALRDPALLSGVTLLVMTRDRPAGPDTLVPASLAAIPVYDLRGTVAAALKAYAVPQADYIAGDSIRDVVVGESTVDQIADHLQAIRCATCRAQPNTDSGPRPRG